MFVTTVVAALPMIAGQRDLLTVVPHAGVKRLIAD
jgi:hypothetical protein